MIIYFSATGNSKYVASRIQQPGEEMIHIPDAVKNGIYNYTVKDGRLGIVSPTYNWTLPSIVSDFLKKMKVTFVGKPYIYYVGTYGTTTGAAAAMADRLMKDKGLSFDAMFDIKMPDTWTPIFDLYDPSHVESINRKAEKEIIKLEKQINKQLEGKHMGLTTPLFTGMIGKVVYDTRTRKTSNFTVEESCIGCGLCAKCCPAEAIEIKDGRPVWVKNKCVMCLGCLHRCPKFAIQHGEKTALHGQYVNPHKNRTDG